MINKNKYIETLTKAKNDLKSGKEWGEVWNNVKNQFNELPSEQIDNDLGLEWRQEGAYDLYKMGKLTPTRPTEKYDYFSDLSLSKYKILKGEDINKIKDSLKTKYQSVDDVKLLSDLNELKMTLPGPGKLPTAGPMTPAIKASQTVTDKEKEQIVAYQKTLDTSYLTGEKDATEEPPFEPTAEKKVEVIELPKEGKVEIVEPKEVIEPVELIEGDRVEESQTDDLTIKDIKEEKKDVIELKELDKTPAEANLFLTAFGKDDKDILDLDRKYGDNVNKISLPENKDIYDEVATVTKAKIDEIIKPILGATSPGYSFISEKLQDFYEEKSSEAFTYRVNKAVNDPNIDSSSLPNPFFTDLVLPKYEETFKKLPMDMIDMNTKMPGSTIQQIEVEKKEKDLTVTLMSPTFNSSPFLIIPDQTAKDLVGKRVEKEVKLEKWKIDLNKARKDKENLITKDLSKAISEFSKLGIGNFGDTIPTMEELNAAIVKKQTEAFDIPSDSLIGKVRIAQKDMIVQESGIIGEINANLSDVFGASATDSARILREKFGEGADNLIDSLSKLNSLDASGKVRNELNDLYTQSVETESSLTQKYKDSMIEVEKLLAIPGMNDYLNAAQKDLSEIEQQEYVSLLNFHAQNKADLDKLNTLGKRVEDIKIELTRNSNTGSNAVKRFKEINNDIKNNLGGLMSAVLSDNFRKKITTAKIMSSSDADTLIKLVKVYEKNRVFVEKNNDKFLKELDNYDEGTQVALLEEGVLQDKLQNIFEEINNIANEITDAEKRINYYSGFDEIYELERQSKIAEAVNKSNPLIKTAGTWLAPWTAIPALGGEGFKQFVYKSQKKAVKEVFGEDAMNYDYKDVSLKKYELFIPEIIKLAFVGAGKVITYIPSKTVNSVDGFVKFNAKLGTYELSGMERLGIKGKAIDYFKKYNEDIANSPILSEQIGKNAAETAAYAYRNLYTEAFPAIVNGARDTATLMEEVLVWEEGNIDLIRDWFLRGVSSVGLSDEARGFLESYSEVTDPYLQGTRLIHAIRLGMNNPDAPENADLLVTEYDKKVVITPVTGKLEDFLDPWDYERIEEIKSLNKNIENFDDIPLGTELIIQAGNPEASKFLKDMDKRDNFIAGRISEDRFSTTEAMSLHDIVKPGPDREKIISSILDLNDFNAYGLTSDNTKDWTKIPKGITIRVPKAYKEPILLDMLLTPEKRLKWSKEHPVRYTLFEEAIMKNVIDPINFLWFPGMKMIKIGSETVLKAGYSKLATAAEKATYLKTAKKMADFTWSMSRVLFQKKAPLKEFYSNPDNLGLFQLIGKGMEINKLDLTTLSVFRTKLASMSVVNSLPEMFRPIVRMTDNEIKNLREMNTIKYVEALNKIMDEKGLSKDQIETFLINYIKAGSHTTVAERDIFHVFSDELGLSIQEIEDIIDTSHPDLYYNKVYTSKVTDLKDVVDKKLYDDPIKLAEIIRINDFKKREIDPSNIPAGVKVIISEDNFIQKVKNSVHYQRYVTKPELEYMMLRLDKLDKIGLEAFFNMFRRVVDKDRPFRLIDNQGQLDASISKMHAKYPESAASINQAVDLAKEYRRRTNFFADAVEKDILIPVKMTDNIKLFAMEDSKNFKEAFTLVKNPDTGIMNLVYNKKYTGKLGLGMDLIAFNTKLYSKKINNLERPVGTINTNMKYMTVSGGKTQKTWFKDNKDGSVELMVQESSGQKPKVGYKWKVGEQAQEVTLRSLLVTAAIRKDKGWLRTFFTKEEYAMIYGSKIPGTDKFTPGLIDQIISSSEKKIKIKESYRRDFSEIVEDVKSKKRFVTDEQEINVFTGDKEAEFLLSLSASVQDLYRTNRKLFNTTYGALKKTYDIIQTNIENKLPYTHIMTPVEELTLLIMKKVDTTSNFFGDRNSKIIGRLLNETNITESQMKSIYNDLQSLAQTRTTQLKSAIILNKLKKEGLSEQAINEINNEIRTKFTFNTAKGESIPDSLKRLFRTIPGFISPEDAKRLSLGKLSDEQVFMLGVVNKAEYLYATNRLNRRFTYLAKKNISDEMMPEVINKFTKPMVDAAVDLMAKLDMDSTAPKTRMAAIINDVLIHNADDKVVLSLHEGIVSHEIIDALDKLELDAATIKLSLEREKIRYRKSIAARKKVKSDKFKYFEKDISDRVDRLSIDYKKARDKAISYAEEHGQKFMDRLSSDLEIISSSRMKMEMPVTKDIESLIYTAKADGKTLVISDRTPEGKTVIKFLRNRPKEFVEGSDFIVSEFNKIKAIMTPEEIAQVMIDNNMNPLVYWMLDKANGLSLYNDDLADLLGLSIDSFMSEELKQVYFNKLYRKLITTDIFSFDVFKKEFPNISEQRLRTMSRSELEHEIVTSTLSLAKKKELLDLARKKGAQILREKLTPSDIEQITIVGKTEKGLEALASDIKDAKKQTPVGKSFADGEIPEGIAPDKLKELSLVSNEAKESRINISFDDKILQEMEELNSALYGIKKSLGISSMKKLDDGRWKIEKAFDGNQTTSDQLLLLNITNGKYIGPGKLTDEALRRTSKKVEGVTEFNKEEFVSKLGEAFDVPNKIGYEDLEIAMAKTSEVNRLRVDQANIEKKFDLVEEDIGKVNGRIAQNDRLIANTKKEVKDTTAKENKIKKYDDLNNKFNASITKLERSANELRSDLNNVNKKIDSISDASDFLVNNELFSGESYKYVQARITGLDETIRNINKSLKSEPDLMARNNMLLSKSIAERELARYKSVLDVMIPFNLAKTNGIIFTGKEIYQAAKGYISPDMEDGLERLAILTDKFAETANAGSLKKIKLDDVNLPTVKMSKINNTDLKINFWDKLSNVKNLKEISVPKVDTITMDSINDTAGLINTIKELKEKTSYEGRYTVVIDLTGKLKTKLEHNAPELLKGLVIITDKEINSGVLKNINTSAGTLLTEAEVKTYNTIVDNINSHGSVWLFGERSAKINPNKLKDAFYNKALNEDEILVLRQARKDFDRINRKFRESVGGDTMLFPEDPNSLVSEYIGIKEGDLTKETIAQSDAVTASRVNRYMNNADVERYMLENNVGETNAASFKEATKNKQVLVLADDRYSTLFKEHKNALDEARNNGITFVFPKEMTRGELAIQEYLNQFPGVKMLSIKNSEIVLLKKRNLINRPTMLFTISKKFSDNNRQLLFEAWTKLNDYENGVLRIFNSSEQISKEIQSNLINQIREWTSKPENFLPEFTRQKAAFGERPKDILIDLASVKKTNDIKKALDNSTRLALVDFREQLMKTIPDSVDSITKKAMIKQIENEVASTEILMNQIKTEVFKFGKKKRFLEDLRLKISSRLTFYSMFDKSQQGLNPGYPDVIPENVLALRSAEWILTQTHKASSFISGVKSVIMGSWIRAVLLYRPRWQIWNAMGDSVRAVGASKNVLVMLLNLEALTRAMSRFYWKAFKETAKLPLEFLPGVTRNKLAKFMKHDLIDIDFTKPISKTKYFELKSGLQKSSQLMREGGISPTGELITPAQVSDIVSSGIDRIIASPDYAHKKITLIRDSGLASRLSKRLKVIDSDIQIVSSVLETSRRAVLAWELIYKKSMNIAATEMKVKKWMFDYRELTLAGRLMRNFFPFYTFTAKSLQLYLGLCAKYGPGTWRAATAILNAFEEQHKDLPDAYKNRIKVGDNIWFLTSFGILEYFEMLFNPTKMVQEFLKNPSRMLFGLSLGPIGSSSLSLITGKGYYDTSASTQEFYDRGWTTEEIDNFRKREDVKFSDGITFDKSKESLYTFLSTLLPFGQFADSLAKVDLATVLRGNTTMNSRSVRTLMNYFLGINYKKMEDIEIVFDSMMKLPPGEQYILKEVLKRDNPDLYDYLQQYSLLSKINKILDSTGKEWNDKAKDLVKSIVTYNYYNLETNEHGSGDEWLNENPQYKKIMEDVWASGAQTSSKIYGKQKFEVSQIRSIANKILSNVKDADDKKIAKMRLAGIDIPFAGAISKTELKNEFYDSNGNFRLNSLDQLTTIVDAYGLIGELFDINRVKTEAEKSYQDWRNLSLKAREEKRIEDQLYYDKMSIVFKVLPNNLDSLSQEEAAKVWNKYNKLLNDLILSNPEYKKKYLEDMPVWQRKYNEFKVKYSSTWDKLRDNFDDPDVNFFKEFEKQPSWFKSWYFYDNPNKVKTFSKFNIIFNELKKNPDANYYDLFYQKLGDKEWDEFRSIYFADNPLKKRYYPTVAIYYKSFAKLEGLKGEEASEEFGKIYDWLWSKQDALKAWDEDKPGQYIYIEKSRELSKSGSFSDYYHRFYSNDDASWEKFRKMYFERHPLRELYYPLALNLEGKTWAEREEMLKDPAYKKAIDAWNKEKPGSLEKTQAYLQYEKQWTEFNAIDNLSWEGKRERATYLKENPGMVKLWDNNDTPEELAIKHKQREYFDILYEVPADGKGKEYLTKYYVLKAKAEQYLNDNPELQKYWDKNKKEYTGKEKVIRDLLAEYGKLTLQIEKTNFLLKHPEVSDYFLNQSPPGIRRLMILEKLYFQLEDTKKRTAFLQARPELVEYWEIKKMPASFLTNPEIKKEYEDKLKEYSRFTDAIIRKNDVQVELFRKSVNVKPDTSTEEGAWLASKMYTDSMKAWASTFGSIYSTYFFRALPQWIRNKYFEGHPKSKVLSYMSMGRALDEGMRIYNQQNKTESWANAMMYKYGKDMPYQLKNKVSREMIRLGKWEDRTAWSKDRWAQYQLEKTARTNSIRLNEITSNRLLNLEAKKVAATYPRAIFSKPLKEFGTINVFLGAEELLLRRIPYNKRVMKLFDYET